jgi:hypothetical protein
LVLKPENGGVKSLVKERLPKLETPYYYMMYMNGEMKIEVPAKRREGNGKFLNQLSNWK